MIQSWGNDGRLANRRLERSSNSTRLSSLTYGYDANDNITAITDTLTAIKTRTYAYDAIDRLNVSIWRGPRRGLGRGFPVPGCEFM